MFAVTDQTNAVFITATATSSAASSTQEDVTVLPYHDIRDMVLGLMKPDD